jgi:hypothetical protein
MASPNKQKPNRKPVKKPVMKPKNTDIKLAQIQSENAEAPSENKYYLSVSSGFRAAKVVTVIMLMVFLIMMLAGYRDSITYDNFKYLIRDLDTSYAVSSSGAGSIATVRYDAQPNMRFTVFRNEIAVAGSSKVALYNNMGTQTLSESAISAAPVLKASDKYMLLYDLGGLKVTLYNSFTKVLEKSFQYQIYDAEICDSGAFAVLTRSLEAKYEVLFCNGSFTPSARYYKNKYVIDIALSGDGGEIAILSADSTGADFTSELMVCATNSSEAKFTYTIDNAFPIAAHFFADGGLAAIFDNRIIFYDSDGVKLRQYDTSGGRLSCMDATGKNLAVVLGTNAVNSANNVIIFDTEGNILYNTSEDAKIKDAALTDDRLYLLATCSVVRVKNYAVIPEREEIATAGSVLRLLALSDAGREPKKCAVLCTETSSYAVFDEIIRQVDVDEETTAADESVTEQQQ